MGLLNALRLEDWITHMVVAPGDLGYWLVSRQGVVSAIGSAELHQIELGRLQPKAKPANANLTVSPDGVLVTDIPGFHRGDIDALRSGGVIQKLQGSIIDIVVTLDRKGYWLVGTDGGVFAFGSAPFHGSLGGFRHQGYPDFAYRSMGELRSRRLKPIHLQLAHSSVPA